MTHSTDDEELRLLQSAEEYLVQSAIIGRDLTAFKNSTAGRFLLGRAMEEVTAATETLLVTDPRYDLDACVQAYQRAQVARNTLHWIYNAISEGETAEQTIINELPEVHLDEVFHSEQI